MARDTPASVNAVLQHVKPSRRDLLKRLLISAGAAALMVPLSAVLANAQETDTGKGKDKSTGNGKGKGKKKGKKKGKGKSKSKAKNKGKGSPGTHRPAPPKP
jgi:hypothetical protein